jgi:hypothetical protein
MSFFVILSGKMADLQLPVGMKYHKTVPSRQKTAE